MQQFKIMWILPVHDVKMRYAKHRENRLIWVKPPFQPSYDQKFSGTLIGIQKVFKNNTFWIYPNEKHLFLANIRRLFQLVFMLGIGFVYFLQNWYHAECISHFSAVFANFRIKTWWVVLFIIVILALILISQMFYQFIAE